MYHLLLFCFFLLISVRGNSQQTALKSEIKVFDEKEYKKEYHFSVIDGDTLLNGTFHFYNTIPNHQRDSIFNYLYLSGINSNNVPDGLWKIHKGQAEVQKIGFFNNYLFSNELNGEELIYSGLIKGGNKTGKWELIKWNYKQSTISDTSLFATIPYQSGVVSGKLKIKKNGNFMEGEVSQSGYTDGVWSYYSVNKKGKKELLEEWVFETGRLKEKINHLDETKVSLQVSAQDIESVIEDVELSENYFKIIELKAKVANENTPFKIKGSTGLYSLFLESLSKLNAVDSITFSESNVEFRPIIKTKIESFPYLEEETIFFKKFANQVKLKDSLILLFSNNPKIDLAEISSPKVTINLAVLSAIQNQIGNSIDSLLLYHTKNYLTYLNRERFIRENIKFSSKVKLNTIEEIQRDSVYIFNQNFQDNSKNTYELLGNYMNYLVDEIRFINDSLDYYLFEIKKEQNLLEKEAELLEKSKNLKQLNDSLVSDFQNELAGFDLTKSISDFIDEELGHYANLSDIEEKARRISMLLDCFVEVEQLIFFLERIPNQYFTVKDAYTKEVFNPYTFTNMEEVSKPTIFKSFNKVILPALFNNINQLTCDRVEVYKNNFSIAFQGMIDLLKEDTKKKERKIKRIKDPKEAAEYINLQLVFH